MIPWRRKWKPRESHGQRSLVCSVHWVTNSQAWLRRLSTHIGVLTTLHLYFPFPYNIFLKKPTSILPTLHHFCKQKHLFKTTQEKEIEKKQKIEQANNPLMSTKSSNATLWCSSHCSSRIFPHRSSPPHLWKAFQPFSPQYKRTIGCPDYTELTRGSPLMLLFPDFYNQRK